MRGGEEERFRWGMILEISDFGTDFRIAINVFAGVIFEKKMSYYEWVRIGMVIKSLSKLKN